MVSEAVEVVETDVSVTISAAVVVAEVVEIEVVSVAAEFSVDCVERTTGSFTARFPSLSFIKKAVTAIPATNTTQAAVVI